ncbi:TIGR04086 family membrane protein [Bacillus gobiensis]
MTETKQVGRGIVYGLITIFALMLISSLILSLLLTFTSLREPSMNWIVTALSFITIFIGGIVSAGKAKERGWLIGAITAISYTLILLLFQYLGFGKGISLEQGYYHAGFLLTCMLGGIFGVNLFGSRS